MCVGKNLLEIFSHGYRIFEFDSLKAKGQKRMKKYNFQHAHENKVE